MHCIARYAVLAVTVALCVVVTASDAVGLYDYPRVHMQQSRLRAQLMQAVKTGNITNMESVCRQGLKLMPGDATWQYNLACALAYRATPDAALDALELAVKAGFRNADAIEKDLDLKRISSNARFKSIVQSARETAFLPVPGRPVPKLARLTMGTKLVLGKVNLVWDFDRGLYNALFKFLRGSSESPEAMAALYDGPAKEMVAVWLADGTASGNAGDLYINRDGDHSRIDLKDFPLLSEFRFESEARRKGIDRAVPNTLYPGALVVGNASLAIVTTNSSCSIVRMAMQDIQSSISLRQCYLNNQFWVFPAHKDFDLQNGIDLFDGVTPCALMSVGSSGSDRYYVRAALAASAALRPDVKKALKEQNLFAPFMQYLFRRTRKGVETPEDYLTSKAHPTAFDRQSLDAYKTVQFAHEFTVDAIAPAVLPLSTYIPVRKTDLEKEFDFRFFPYPKREDVSFCWRVVHGDEKRVKIVPGAGGEVHFSVNCSGLSERIDIACFAKTAKSDWGAPSFVCIYPISATVKGRN
ncbi:MAG: hypothetical protein J6R18_03630 [Kiritimatiellae bacterium]|nr:hypothetical protein [Kiritimatiellia bacterium]